MEDCCLCMAGLRSMKNWVSDQATKNITARLPLEIDLSLEHLEAELGRLDVLIHREVRCWQRAGQDAADPFRGQYVSDAEASTLTQRPFGTSWGRTVALEPQERQAFTDALAQAEQHVRSLVKTARRQGTVLRLECLASAFGLDRFDLDAFLVCLAPALDLRYERLYGYLQDDVTRKRPGVNLILDLLCEPGAGRLLMLSHFADDTPLFKYHLLERVSDLDPLLSQTLQVDEIIVAWLLGRYQPHADLGAHASLSWPEEDEANELLAPPLKAQLDHAVFTTPSDGGLPVLVFYGPDRASQVAAARRLSAQVHRPLLQVDLAAATQTGVPPFRALRLALRDARLTGAIVFLVGWDACLADGVSSPELLAELCAYPDLAIIAGRASWHPRGIDRGRRLLWLEFPIPAYAQRHALWKHFLDQADSENSLDLTSLAGQFLLTTDQIRDAVALARDMAAQRVGPLQSLDLFAAARAHSSSRLAALVRKIEPRYAWQDIILPDDPLALLCEIVATVRGRPLVLDEWGVGQKLVASAGVTVLFSGPPGTGKTMAAEVIAAELGLDLYKIDLSTVVSKYIGETEKNLERIFKEAENSNAILFFDEADAIFGKRSEVKDSHDRYANIEISYLLQRMEAYNGVTVLATNLRANLDEAFTRRLQFAVDFPFPEQSYRLRIWQALFPPDVPRDPGLDFDLLARRFKLAGGNIRNIIVSAAYLAAADGKHVTMNHLLHGARRELQKMGRWVNEADMKVG